MKMPKKQKNDHTAIAVCITALLLAAGFALLFIADALFPFRRHMMLSEGADSILAAREAFSFLALALSAYLLFIYIRDYLELRSEFSLVLVLVMCSFMMYAITTNPVVYAYLGIGQGAIGFYSLIPLAFTLVALFALAWVSSK